MHPDEPSRVLLQTRSKAWAGRYQGLLELPQGHIDPGESLLDCVARELREETGLTDFRPRDPVSYDGVLGEQLSATTSLVVSESGDQAYLAVCIVGTASGVPRPSDESADPGWYGRDAVYQLMVDERIFPLNVPMLRWHFALDADV